MGSQDLQHARYDQLVRRVGALYGGGSKVVEVLPEVFPVLELENTTPELLALSGWRLAWQSTERPAVVGQLSTSQLFNPAGSGVIVAVTHFRVRVDTANTTIQAEISPTIIGVNQVKGLFRDSRFGGNRQTTAEVSSVDNIVVGGGLRVIVGLDDLVISDDNGLVVLTPGFGLSVGTQQNDILMTITYFWRERIAQESELLFP